jgi:PAS domain S-box-containing protein
MNVDGSVETARNRISKALSQDDWFRSQPVLTLAAAAALFAGVFALRQVSGDAKDAITMLYALPVALIALRFGAAAGLGAAALGMALFGVWAESDDSNIGWLGVLSRAVALFLIGGLVGYFSDRLRSVLETVRGKEEQLQSIIDNTTAVIYLKDEDGRYLLINRQFERLFHIDRHEVIGKTDYDLFPRYMADAFRSNDRRTLKGGTALELEEVAPHDDGPHTYISLKFPVLDAAGASYGVCGISTDITTRKGTEAALKEGQDRVRRILDTAHEAFVSMDGKGVIREWNSAAEETFGWPRAKVIGRPLAEVIIPPRFREAHQRGIEQFVKTGEGPLMSKRIELPALHRKGHELPVELTISPVKVQGGYLFNAFLHDVSERKRAEEDETRLTPLGPFGEEPPGPV